jgi:hypothetical protein
MYLSIWHSKQAHAHGSQQYASLSKNLTLGKKQRPLTSYEAYAMAKVFAITLA